MPRGARVKGRSGIYHIMLRGANKQEIFHDDEDCRRFLDTIEKYKIKSNMKVFALCLMNNHVHLLLKEGEEDISVTMKRIGVSFVSYYNKKYSTTGHLFQDRFRSENVETRRYFLTVIRYIHQNPVKAGIVNRVDKWCWSSCLEYYGKGILSKGLIDNEFVLRMFSTNLVLARERFREFNEQINDDQCLDDNVNKRRRLTDEEARQLIKELLGDIMIAQVKSFPRRERNEMLRKVKALDGISQRQAARILGVSPNLIFKA